VLLKNNKGFTLIELLLTITISFSILGLVSGVLIQSTKANNISNAHINLRQEANILITTLSSNHTSVTRGSEYEISCQIIDENTWVMTIGNQSIQSQSYHIKLELKSGTSSPIIIDTGNKNLIGTKQTYKINNKNTLYVKTLQLTDKTEKKQSFEISTTISRL
jgi:type II secretory pathway pseudopilin PulG